MLDNLDPNVLASTDLRDIASCWELSLLPAKQAEWPAFRLNAGDALDRIVQYIQPPGRLLDFGCGYLPEHVASATEAFARRLGLWQSVLRVNLGDIVAAIAPKGTR